MVTPLLVAAGRLPRGWRRGRSSRSGQRLVRSVRSAAPHAVRAAATTEAGARQDMVLLARRHAHHQTPREETQLRCSAWLRVECRRSPHRAVVTENRAIQRTGPTAAAIGSRSFGSALSPTVSKVNPHSEPLGRRGFFRDAEAFITGGTADDACTAL